MKKTWKPMIILHLIFTMASCGGNKSSDKTTRLNQTPLAVNIQQLMEMAADSIGKEIWVSGVVTHVCRHSGKRCFISDGENSIRIEATGNIFGFNNELQGSKIHIKGVIREKRIEAEIIAGHEAEAIADLDHNHSDGEHCSEELQNIKEMIEWMETNNKDYFSIYYLDGTDYELTGL
jgi:hypothetical protein